MNILFSLCWLDEPGRLERNLKWLSYYRNIKSDLGYDQIILVDNASDIEELKKLKGHIIDAETRKVLHTELGTDLYIYRYGTHLPRISIWDIPYCWRGLEFMKTLLPKVDKILAIDTDCYVLTKKFATFLKDQNTGWVAPWCEKYGFPETSLFVLSKDSFHLLENFPIPSYNHYATASFETWIPFTDVLKTFKGSRYGETGETQLPEYDYYCQWGIHLPELVYEKT